MRMEISYGKIIILTDNVHAFRLSICIAIHKAYSETLAWMIIVEMMHPGKQKRFREDATTLKMHLYSYTLLLEGKDL